MSCFIFLPVSSAEWDDHMFSHTLEDHALMNPLGDDSLLALELHQQEQRDATAALYTQTEQALVQELNQQEMAQVEDQPCQWDDKLLAHALQNEEQRNLNEQRRKEDEEFRKLQVQMK